MLSSRALPFLAASLAAAASCERQELRSPGAPELPASSGTAAIRRGELYIPRREAPERETFQLAPLIIQELRDAPGAEASDRIGRAVVEGGGEIAGVEPSDVPRVYVLASTARIAGRERRQLLYQWRYPGRETGRSSARGVRLTLDSAGYPAIVESLGGSPGRRVLFVAKRVEDAARREHGAPLPGRAHALEAAAGAVAGLLDEGPLPMGPFIYLAHTTRAAKTALCRCSPSRVERLERTHVYELVPLDAPLGDEDEHFGSLPPLEEVLRLPEAL